MDDPDVAYIVLGEWPLLGEQIWRGGLFDSEEEAREAFDDYCANEGHSLRPRLTKILRLTVVPETPFTVAQGM